ncbi:MAG: hypothetical protein ACFCVG_04485 [Kineosporiaceae bacterium]
MSAAPSDQPSESAADAVSDAMFEYGSDDRDVDGILDPEQAMGLDAEEELEDGYSPPDEPTGVEEFGTTVEEQMTGESLADREMRSHPDGWIDPGLDTDRADRLVDSQEGGPVDTEADLVAREVVAREVVARELEGEGDLTAEEAAIHRIDPEPGLERDPGTVATDEGSTNT